MVNSEKRQFANDRQIDGDDQNSDGEESVDVSLRGVMTPASANSSITRRLTEIFLEDGDEDLLLQRSDREDDVLQWLRALDMQVMGACRADERLKPLLKFNVSNDVAEDRLLAHLSQHFEPSEVGLLARCLCLPLVSIRVGKINKLGTLLSPTSIRGNLCLTLLPTSDLRISFNGDDGTMERLATLSSEAQCTAIQIEEISADKSGRSFLIKTTDSVVSYFWYSEKSKLLGNELLGKIKDLLMRKPSLAELSGISEARLNCFATHLRAYLAGSMVVSAHAGGVLSASPPSDDSVDSSELHLPQYSQQCSSQGSKTNLIYQGKIFPRSNSFKEGLPISLSSVRTADTEKLKRCRENYASCIDSLSLASTNSSDPSNSNCFGKNKLTEANGVHPFATMNFVDPFGKSAELPLSGPKILVPSSGPSHFSPQYCWCPPVASTLQYRLGNSKLPTSSTESLSLPPLASLLSAARPSSLLTSEPSLNLSEVPPVNFPSLLPEPLVRFPTLHQFPTFTPLICGPIVHIPVIEVGSSGPGYLVSAGPAMHTTLPPLNPNLVDSVLPNAESMVEKSARETLRMLISSSNQPKQQLLSSSNQPKPQLLDVLPSVLSSNNDKQNVIATASRGLYGGTRDEDVISSSMTSMGLVLLSEKPLEGCVGKICASRDDSIDKKQKPSTSGSTGFDSGMNWF